MKIAVIGGGLFGLTAATFTKRAGHDVTLFEKNELMSGASTHNQFRLHRGYHYPRSPETVRECQEGLKTFAAEYEDAIRPGTTRIYALAKNNSKTSAGEYLQFCDIHNLPIGEDKSGYLDKSEIQLSVSVSEDYLNPLELSGIAIQNAINAGVKVVYESYTGNFDKIIMAVYSETGNLSSKFGLPEEYYQFEVCEKPIVKVPGMGRASVVIMDGPFCSIDPYLNDHHLMGHVEHAIWQTSYGVGPVVPQGLKKYINKGIIINPEHSRFNVMREAASQFVPLMKQARHVGSLFTIRAVLIGEEETDARPTIVTELNDKVIRIFSGKLPTACSAAQEVVRLIA